MTRWLRLAALTLAAAVSSDCLADEDAIVEACRQFLKADGKPEASVVETIKAYDGPIEPIIERLSATPGADWQDVSGVVANQSFQHPSLKAAYVDDRLHFFVPDSYAPEKPFGLVIFMHGGGRTTPREHPLHVVTHPDDDPQSIGLQPHVAGLPFILVAPSAPWNETTGARWNVPEADDYLRAVIEECCFRFNVDRDRVILGGYSMGGFGAFHLCLRLNDRLAGGFVYSGAWKTMYWPAWTGLPLFMRHGRHDASPPGEDGTGGRPRFTDVFYSRTAHQRLQQTGLSSVYVEDDGDHRIRPASDAMARMAAWLQTLRRDPDPKHVVAITPRGWRASTDSPTPHSHWVTIEEIGEGTIEFDQAILHGPSPSFKETTEDFHKQSFETTTTAIKAGVVDATIEPGNRITVQTQNVRRFSLWLRPGQIDLDQPVTISVNGHHSTHQPQSSLIESLHSYQRQIDWTRIYPARIELPGDESP
jgi:predicted esterase